MLTWYIKVIYLVNEMTMAVPITRYLAINHFHPNRSSRPLLPALGWVFGAGAPQREALVFSLASWPILGPVGVVVVGFFTPLPACPHRFANGSPPADGLATAGAAGLLSAEKPEGVATLDEDSPEMDDPVGWATCTDW